MEIMECHEKQEKSWKILVSQGEIMESQGLVIESQKETMGNLDVAWKSQGKTYDKLNLVN